MRRLWPWMAALGPDRILAVTVVTGLALALSLVTLHFQAQVGEAKRQAQSLLLARAAALDGELARAGRQLEQLRHQATLYLKQVPTPGAVPDTPLLSAFLASGGTDGANRAHSLDQPPPPYAAGDVGTLLALDGAMARRREGLTSSDAATLRHEAALGLAVMPALSASLPALPQARRVYYASTRGLVALVPWVRGGGTDLLDSYPTSPAYRRLAEVTDPAAPAAWSAMPGDGGATLALALLQEGRLRGMFAAEFPAAGLSALLGPPPADGMRLLLLDERGRPLAATGGQLPDRLDDILPGGAAALPGLTPLPRSEGGSYLAAQGLAAAPWRLLLVADGVGALYPGLGETVQAMGGLVLILAVVLLLSRWAMLRALAGREAAALAERQSRAAAESALEDLRAAHDELDFLNREKTRFFSLVSHDLRGPFNALLGMTEELANQGTRMRPADVADFAGSVHESALKVFDLLENLLQWSRVQMSGKPFAPTAFPLRELVGDAIRDVSAAADAKSIQILDAVGDRWVLADRTMVLAILRNLLVNAVKFSHPEGVVHVTSRAQGDRLEVAVTDRGVGMDTQELHQVARPGPGPSRPGTQGEKGTGLGLTLVRDLVLRHGGGLKVDSVPGKGTVVTFTVPLATNPAEARRAGLRVAE
ncbi:hypothetical protein HHL28_16330 [Aerophototrophica crusticola]|uniref:histidine kinase n=1 Tax=Aerophototrophica crusticola TaxID=1709002 RepID=A0A858RAC1_9PROT|nr:hypothetical protein HHL28_16330 [Rhodospirillaceae bacterium B3]